MTIKPERPDLEWFRRRVDYEDDGLHAVVRRSHALWLLDMLERAEKLIEPEAAYERDWTFDADEWLREYRGESDGG